MAIAAFARLDPFPTPGQAAARDSEAFELAFNAGARGQVTTFTWRALEPTQGTYDADKLQDLAAAINKARARSMVQYLGIQVINTSALEVPAGLEAEAFDSPVRIARFRALLDQIVTPHRGRIAYLSIGNEIDVYLRAHPTQWAAYQRFYEDAAQYARSLDPALKVGVTATADGAVSFSTADLQAINATSDVVILTYYPLAFDVNAFITVRPPSDVSSDFTNMLAFAGAKTLVLQEVGYPASTINASSQTLQAGFVRAVFSAWSRAGRRIPFLTFFHLHDFTQTMCDDFSVYYQAVGSSSFNAYLCTLGLRRVDGTPRDAWYVLETEARRANLP